MKHDLRPLALALLLASGAPALAADDAALRDGWSRDSRRLPVEPPGDLRERRGQRSASAQIAKLTEEAQAEVLAERKPLEEEARKLEARRSSSRPKYSEQRPVAGPALGELQKRLITTREIEATRQRRSIESPAKAQPVLATVYKQRRCGECSIVVLRSVAT